MLDCDMRRQLQQGLDERTTESHQKPTKRDKDEEGAPESGLGLKEDQLYCAGGHCAQCSHSCTKYSRCHCCHAKFIDMSL